MKTPRLLAVVALLAVSAGSCAPGGDDDEVLVFAASSLADVAPRLGELHGSETGERVRFSFGSTAALLRQVRAGAPAQLVLAAGGGEETARALPPDFPFAWNELVLVTQADASWPPEGLSAVASLAVGDWAAGVPVGLRAREWLRRGELAGAPVEEGWSWSALRERLVPCVDARATLAAVASGGVQAGIVYSTDAASTDRVRVVRRGGGAAPAVVYLALETPETTAAARDFARFLRGPAAGELLRRHGFGVDGLAGRGGPS